MAAAGTGGVSQAPQHNPVTRFASKERWEVEGARALGDEELEVDVTVEGGGPLQPWRGCPFLFRAPSYYD